MQTPLTALECELLGYVERLATASETSAQALRALESRSTKGALAKGADVVMREALNSGELERGALPSLLGVSDRQARKVTAEPLAVGALKSDT